MYNKIITIFHFKKCLLIICQHCTQSDIYFYLVYDCVTNL